MRFYPKFKSNIQKGDYVSFDTMTDNLYRVLNVSKDGLFILVMEYKKSSWKTIIDLVSVWGVSYE